MLNGCSITRGRLMNPDNYWTSQGVHYSTRSTSPTPRHGLDCPRPCYILRLMTFEGKLSDATSLISDCTGGPWAEDAPDLGDRRRHTRGSRWWSSIVRCSRSFALACWVWGGWGRLRVWKRNWEGRDTFWEDDGDSWRGDIVPGAGCCIRAVTLLNILWWYADSYTWKQYSGNPSTT